MGWFDSRWLLCIPVCGKTSASTAAAYPSMDELRSTKPLPTVSGMHPVPVHSLHSSRWWKSFLHIWSSPCTTVELWWERTNSPGEKVDACLDTMADEVAHVGTACGAGCCEVPAGKVGSALEWTKEKHKTCSLASKTKTCPKPERKRPRRSSWCVCV